MPTTLLDTTEAVNSTNLQWCCNEMLKMWLARSTDATWKDILAVIDSPTITQGVPSPVNLQQNDTLNGVCMLISTVYVTVDLSQRISLGNNGPAGPIFDTKTGLGGPILVDQFRSSRTSFGIQNWSTLTKIGPGLAMQAFQFHTPTSSKVAMQKLCPSSKEASVFYICMHGCTCM